MEFVKAISFDGDGLSDVAVFKGTATHGMEDCTFKISNISGSKSDTSNKIDTVCIYYKEKPIGFIVIEDEESEDVLMAGIDLTGDGKINEADHLKLKGFQKLVRDLQDSGYFDSYFGVSAEELYKL